MLQLHVEGLSIFSLRYLWKQTISFPKRSFKRGGESEGGDKGRRRRKNFRERKVIDAYLKDGWEIITRGMPTFLARKPGQPLRAVWVERQNVIPEKAGLTQTQTLVRSIFMTKEIDCRIERGGPRLSRVNKN